MRPLTLRIEGLRSYTHLQEIDFTNLSLVAIVGDTGAGKSSILEALCVALYGSSTWSGRELKALISDGAAALKVALTFRAERKTWRVTRTSSRGASPPPLHLLECLDDDTIPPRSGAKDVNREVERLVGLSHEAFTRVVVLPQGRFQRLLLASPSERTAILKGIFRLERLDDVRSRASAAHERTRPRLAALREERASLLPDPDAAADDARARSVEANAELARLQAIQQEVVAVRARIERGQSRVRALDEVRVRLEAARVPDARARIDEVAARAAQLDLELGALTGALESLSTRIRAKEQSNDHARARGHDAATCAAALAVLEPLRHELLGFDAERTKHQADGAALAALRTSLDDEEQALGALQAAAAEATAHVQRATRDVERARSRAHLSTLRRAHAEAIAARGVLDAQLQVAAGARDDARRAQDAAVRAHAAAHVAAAAAPGTPCPVCARKLPQGFHAPEAPALDVAARAVDEAERAAAALAKAQARAAGQVERAAQSLDDAARALGDDVDLDAQAEADGSALAETALQAARAAEAAAHARVEQALLALSPRRAVFARARDAVIAAEAALARAESSWVGRAAALPADFRPPRLSVDAIEPILGHLRVLLEARAADDAALEELRREHAAQASRRATLEVFRRRDVDDPLRTLSRALDRLAARLDDASDLVGIDPRVWAVDVGMLDELAKVAVALDEEACAALAAIAQARVEEQEAVAAADARLAPAYQQGLVDDEALNRALREAAARAGIAERDLARAVDEAPRAVLLDDAIARIEPVVDAVEEIARLLSDGRFMGHVVARKQRVLLAVASDILADVTGNRFGFAEDFLVVDRVSGATRDPMTLSGGETFLASLALALSLVELAGRSGGRLEALFLDEGFGSLDANALGEALDVLTAQAQRGRMVAVISHLRAVAEAFEDVLVVTKGPRGSEVRALRGDERDAWSDDEASAGLL